MVGHQAIRRDAKPVSLRAFAQKREVHAAVIVREEDVLPIIPPLRHVMRHPGDHHTRLPCHSRSTIARISPQTQQMVTVPVFPIPKAPLPLSLSEVDVADGGDSPRIADYPTNMPPVQRNTKQEQLSSPLSWCHSDPFVNFPP